MTAPRIPGPVSVRWTAETEHVEGTATHGLLVLPETPGTQTGAQPGAHRVYFVAQNKGQLAQLCAVVFGLAEDNGLVLDVMQILREDRGRSFRVPAVDQAQDQSIKERSLGGYCPHCSREVPPRSRDATFSVCRHCGGRYI